VRCYMATTAVTLVMATIFAASSSATARQPKRDQHRVEDQFGFSPRGDSERSGAADMSRQQRVVVMSASPSDARWIASQLNQPHFVTPRNQSDNLLSEVNRPNADAIPGGPRTNRPGSDVGPANVLPFAQRYRGTNPTGYSRAWCAVFANMVLARAGYSGTGSAAARSFARYGRPAAGPAPGVIAVWPHHVGFVVGAVGPGRIRVISGNHNHRVAEGTYSTRSVMAFRYPNRGSTSMAGFASASSHRTPL
jgi:uncharacterized protein (TIGR02594 family)